MIKDIRFYRGENVESDQTIVIAKGLIRTTAIERKEQQTKWKKKLCTLKNKESKNTETQLNKE